MASWKEKGVVPDSDDEDGLDSQSTTDLEGVKNEQRPDEPDALENNAGAMNGNDEEGNTEADEPAPPEATPEEINIIIQEPPLPLIVLKEPLESHVEDHAKSPLSIPVSLKGFKDPRLFWGSDEDDVPQSEHDISFSRPRSGVPAEDEISRSYVQITSPTSTQLSSPPISEPSLPPHIPPNGQRRNSQSPSQQPGLPLIQLCAENPRSELVEEPPASTARRSLRQRNPIQLHPYIVEQEKYRKALKARGIAPMRMASSQDDSRQRSRNTASPDPEFQEHDSQDLSFDPGESQRMDIDWDPPSSSPVRSAALPNNEVINQTLSIGDDDDDDEDEEFPDIDKLLRAPRRIPANPEPKPRLKTYSTKFKRPPLSRIQTQPVRAGRQNYAGMSIFDVPASPPTTSSPFTATSRLFRASLSRAGSSSKEPTPSITMDDPFQQDLPTPATSAVKPAPVLLDSDIESDDPFASDVENSPTGSSSDESVQIRRISKKIRGVLPASHLRLDQRKIAKPTTHTQRDTQSASPIKEAARRGVALPRVRQYSPSPPASTNARLAFLSDSEEDDENEPSGFIMEDDRMELESILDQSRQGFAEEDDRIDAMLPSKKRSSTGSNQPRKKRKSGSGLGVRTGSGARKRQPKPTDHLKRPRSHTSLYRSTRKLTSERNSVRRSSGISRPRKPAAPSLGILDVVDTVIRGERELPQFIRVAARTARSRARQGRGSPSRKFIRLANREDTQDAQSVLQDWREGRIAPKIHNPQPRKQIGTPRSALQPLANNQQTRSPPSISKDKSHRLDIENAASPRKLVISRRQQSMNNFVTKERSISREGPTAQTHINHPKHTNKPRSGYHPARPAQLESTEIAYSDRHPVSAFRSTKKVLDALYRSTRRRPAPQTNLQLSRFLADEDVVRPSVDIVFDIDNVNSDDEVDLVQIPSKPAWRKKRAPQRVDAGAANYRQPSDPLILDFFAPTDGPNAASDGSKLLGLGKFGTNYPYHFDVFPLQPGIFFHDSTLIGSRRLSEAFNCRKASSQSSFDSSPTTLKFADKIFTWRTWEENVSSELGVCFDWLLDQFQVQQTSNPPTASASEVIRFVLDYVQHNVIFDGPLGRDDFLSRMVEVLQDFSTRFDTKANFNQAEAKRAVEVLSTSALIILLLLNMARDQPVSNVSSYDFEHLLKSVAGHCVDVLLSQGLDTIRKLYDDLQYLSFRERGIRSDQYAANAWVILIKVLDAAQIQRGSFWDVTNSRLLRTPMKDINDAPTMEKLWYSMYTLLPLCEFDEFGVVAPRLRHSARFDNWTLPQQILKQVFALYKSNQRQPPGFNDYCRSLFHRCHYLMVEWGWWKCPTIIGTLFDFFASHNLAHLRNEEVYASPHFLEQLNTEPSLSIEAEERCFHIFLKIVALGIKHLSQAGDIKSIRNLVARLLPNHDRQYPKDEAIHQRDLAALRNHHDLLCTLFWASPAAQRPPVSLIQELVIAERSHNEACLINIRAWENLTRFIVTKSMDIESYRPFALWQSAFFSSLCQQYLGAEQEVRQQAEVLEKSSGLVMSETRIADTALANRRSMIIPICRSITAMGNVIQAARSSDMVRGTLNPDVLSTALDPAIYVNAALSKPLLSECVIVLCNYMDQIKSLHPPVSTENSGTSDEELDSQDSLEMAMNWGRMELVIPLRHNVMDKLCPLVRRYLEVQFDETQEKSSMTNLVACWARMVSIVSEEGAIALEYFLTHGQYAVFENRQAYQIADSYWPLFLGGLLKNGKVLSDFKVPGFNLGLEWLLGLTICQSVSASQKSFTIGLKQKGHYLCKTIDPERFDQIQMMQAAIRRMSTILIDKTTDAEVGLPHKQAQRIFSDMLEEVMNSIQRLLESLEPGSGSHSYHLQVARVVIADIRSYANDFRGLTDFFVHPSAHYWPHDGDPSLFGAGLISYCIRLPQQPEKTSFELFYYLHNGWKSSLISNSIDNYISCIRKGMKWWDFTKFLLADFIPAVLAAGFNSSGWLLCSTFLPAISNRAIRLLENTDFKSTWVFENLLNILKMIMNGTIMHARRFQNTLSGVHPEHRGILTVTLRFWFAIALPMRQYALRHSQETALEEVSNPLSSFIYNALHTFNTRNGDIHHPDGQFDVHKGKCTDRFVAHIMGDINDYWGFRDEECFKVVIMGRNKECSAVQEVGETLRSMLEIEVVSYECAYPNKDALPVKEKENLYIRDLYV